MKTLIVALVSLLLNLDRNFPLADIQRDLMEYNFRKKSQNSEKNTRRGGHFL